MSNPVKKKIDYLSDHLDYTKTLVFKISFVIALVGFVTFLILYIYASLQTDDCLPAALDKLDCGTRAQYKVTWEFDWNATANGTLPPDAHFSASIGAFYPDSSPAFWSVGNLASNGMKSLAETGNISLVEEEITNLNVDYFSTEATDPDTTTISLSTFIIVPPKHVNVTMAVKISPSPDWFTGISGLKMCNADNHWVNSFSIPLVSINAGTKDGTSFTTPGNDTSDHISYIVGTEYDNLFNSYPVGTVTFTRVAIET
jgi:hypothetical protein